MEPAIPASAPASVPEPYREPRTGLRALLRRKIVWRIALCVAVFGILVAIDQVFVRTQESRSCITCRAEFAGTEWHLDVPPIGLNSLLSSSSVQAGPSRWTEFFGPEHQHCCPDPVKRGRRGVIFHAASESWTQVFPGYGLGGFARALQDQPAFAAHVRSAIERGDVAREDVAAAIEMVEHSCYPQPPTPEERRLRAIANGLYAAWLGKPVAETKLWNELW